MTEYFLTIRGYQLSAMSTYSYLLDWLLYSSTIAVLLSYGALVSPKYHEFSLHDITLMSSHKSEDETTISITMLILISVITPILSAFFPIIEKTKLAPQRRAWDVIIGLLVLCGSMATQLSIVNLLKNVCGLPRPDILSRCFPDGINSTLIEPPPGRLATIDICSNPNLMELKDGFRSFPSGHSSTVFCGMVLTSLNLCGKLQVFDNRGFSLKIVSAIIPLIIATFVSCTRISDNRHFSRDIIAGGIIGSAIAIWFYLQYFPSIFNLENCGRAYPPRRFGVSSHFNHVGGFWKIEDNTEGSFSERHLVD
ncbi:diacylglycerol pyrophosphate phosphatase 1 [[Candida] railenensis]|uniref:Diacylglycerol pyrophosphate phosphatase 1 n=1 Tax=[Candida] railenensis TaxID=45579 RepID=A0A9P0QWA6_9ASCO|nr:diacylglycerol pyrophosphate phosphatase 1 [[Candida] railenensis]